MASQHDYIYTDANGALYQALPGESARAEWNTSEILDSHALGLFNEGGNGLIIDGKPDDILRFVDLLHAHAHAAFDGPGR